MTPRQLEIIAALDRVTFPPATSQKRFARDMVALARAKPDHVLTEKQADYLTKLAWRFRRQMPAHLAYPELDDERPLVSAPPTTPGDET